MLRTILEKFTGKKSEDESYATILQETMWNLHIEENIRYQLRMERSNPQPQKVVIAEEAKRNMGAFKNFPIELLMLLFTIMPYQDQKNFAQTCKAILQIYTHPTNPCRATYLYNQALSKVEVLVNFNIQLRTPPRGIGKFFRPSLSTQVKKMQKCSEEMLKNNKI